MDPNRQLLDACKQVDEAAAQLMYFWAAAMDLAAKAKSAEVAEAYAREFALSLARVHCAALLCSHACASAAEVGAEEDAEEDVQVALRWIEDGLVQVPGNVRCKWRASRRWRGAVGTGGLVVAVAVALRG